MFKNGIGFVWKFRLAGASGLHFEQRFQDAVVFVMESRLISIEERERAIGAGESFEGHSEAMVGGEIGVVVEALLLMLHALFEEAGFDGSVAGDAPMGGGELMDEIGLGLGLGEEMVEIFAELGFVFAGGFAGEDDGAGGESVGEGVESGGFFACGGGGAVGFCAVGAGGGEFAGGGHGVFSPSIEAGAPV